MTKTKNSKIGKKPKRKVKPSAKSKAKPIKNHTKLPKYATMKESNLENYIAGYNKSGFVAYPDPESDELLNAYRRGYNIGIIG